MAPKFNARVLASAAAVSFGIAAAQAAPIVRDHRTVDASTCPGGVAVNGKCAENVKPPRCPKPGYGYQYGYKKYCCRY